jgi:hypothetical protein
MAKTITKTYSVTVTYRYDTGEDITDADLNITVLREKIKERIEGASRISKGNINAQPGVVTEA